MARHPKPAALLKFEKGKLYDEQRDRAALEPQPQKELRPRCPKRFSKEERKAWRAISKILQNYGLFTAANSIQLELLTTAWAQYLDCCEKMTQTKNIIIKDDKNGMIFNPYFRAQHKLGKIIDQYSQNLGLSSISLAKIGSLLLKSKKKKDEMEDLLD